MNTTYNNSNSSGAPQPHTLPNAMSDASPAETTLRLIAQLPAPKGLEDRVLAGLASTPRRGRLLQWPSLRHEGGAWMQGRAWTQGSAWMRGAAAAAIVFVVAGGGWGIYTHVQPPQSTKVIVMPRAGAGGGFSSAGAMRTPQTLDGPVVAEPVKKLSGDAKAADVEPAQVKPLTKTPAKVVPMTRATGKANAEPAVSVVQ